MSRRQKKQKSTSSREETRPEAVKPRRGRSKQWLFRLAAIFGVPIAFLLLLELFLRLFGFGYPPQFLLRVERQGTTKLEQNNKFGWRFFGARMARIPAPISISERKAPATTRIFVFGESAAYGDPQPQFGLARMLEAMLSLRYPERHFEVVNAAMTAINSHVILPISRDCSKADGDIWVIYMGNNEIVGPYGGGSIFGSRGLPLLLIRTALAFKSTRIGELFETINERVHKPPPSKSEWGGLSMFLDQTLMADSPRLRDVYRNFARNLDDIIRTGKKCGVEVVLSTVAVNLRDCAPFASAHRPGLTEAQKAEWENLYKAGMESQNGGKPSDAEAFFEQAAKIDDKFAELHFRKAFCELVLGQEAQALQHFQIGRDLDTLRFRCDGELNAIIRKAASANEVPLADAEETLARKSPGGAPGAEMFYDHVHLTFSGNYLLALTIASKVDESLQKSARPGVDLKWPTEQECAERLGWSEWNRENAAAEMFTRLQDAPFTSRVDNAKQLDELRAQSKKLGTAAERQLMQQARETCEAALRKFGANADLYEQMVSLKGREGDLAGAAVDAQKLLELLPSYSGAWAKRGAVLAQEGKFADAAESFEKAYQLDSEDVFSRRNSAKALAMAGRKQEAIAEYRRTVASKPRFGPAWLDLGQLLEQSGQKAEAERCYQQALTNRVHLANELVELGRFCQLRGWFAAASTNFEDALKMQPSNPMLHLWAGQTLEKLQRKPQAAVHYGIAAKLAPEMPEVRFLHGVALGWEGKPLEAAQEFREAVRLKPDLLEARLNLGIALYRGGQSEEALQQFEEILKQSPGNKLAQQLRDELLEKMNSAEKR